MTEAKPILFSGEMVRAIIEGRKIQTRRVMKVQMPEHLTPQGWVANGEHKGQLMWHGYTEARFTKCPYGHLGDLIWVRETFTPKLQLINGTVEQSDDKMFYRADNPIHPLLPNESDGLRWKPSIHMPRWASRLTLEITDIRVERLQDISEEDARAEGMAKITKDGETYKYGIPDLDGLPGNDNVGWPWHEWETSAVKAFKKLWQSINGNESWSNNPWVWVIEFKVHHCNVDEILERKTGNE